MLISRFWNGFKYVKNGKNILFAVPGIKFWILVPFLVQSVLLGVGLVFGLTEIKLLAFKIIAFFLSDPTTFLGTSIYYLFFIVFALVFSVIYFYFIFLISSIISSPFYSIITEKTLVYKHVMKPRASLTETLVVAFKMLRVSILRGVVLVFVGLLLFVGSFIPLINFVTAFVAFLIMALDSADYAFEALEMSLSERMRFFKSNFIEFAGMATFVGLTALLPGLILFVMPMAVLGATDFVATKKQTQLKSE